MNEIINSVAEATAEAVAENTEVVKTVGTKTVVFFGAMCAGAGVLLDEAIRLVIRACKSKKSDDLDIEKKAKKGFKMLKRKARDVKNDITDAVEDVTDEVKDLLEEE